VLASYDGHFHVPELILIGSHSASNAQILVVTFSRQGGLVIFVPRWLLPGMLFGVHPITGICVSEFIELIEGSYVEEEASARNTAKRVGKCLEVHSDYLASG
jgi:hypothetical protein